MGYKQKQRRLEDVHEMCTRSELHLNPHTPFPWRLIRPPAPINLVWPQNEPTDVDDLLHFTYGDGVPQWIWFDDELGGAQHPVKIWPPETRGPHGVTMWGY